MNEWRNITRNAADVRSKISPGMIIAAFDTETTGVTETAKIIQFSGLKLRVENDFSLTVLDEDAYGIDLYINPEEKLMPKITEITGITQIMVDAIQNERVLAPRIFGWLYDAHVWAAYNKSFDIRMLHQMADRTDTEMYELPSVDVLEWARDFVPSGEVENHKLGTIAKHLNPQAHYQFHSAIEDVKAMTDCMEVFLQKYIRYKPEKNLAPCHLERASLFINPRRPSMQRIRLKLSDGEYGAVFWDVMRKCWSCKSDDKSKRLFRSIDMADIENQFMKRYGYPHGYATPDEVARSWLKYRREQDRLKKQNR